MNRTLRTRETHATTYTPMGRSAALIFAAAAGALLAGTALLNIRCGGKSASGGQLPLDAAADVSSDVHDAGMPDMARPLDMAVPDAMVPHIPCNSMVTSLVLLINDEPHAQNPVATSGKTTRLSVQLPGENNYTQRDFTLSASQDPITEDLTEAKLTTNIALPNGNHQTVEVNLLNPIPVTITEKTPEGKIVGIESYETTMQALGIALSVDTYEDSAGQTHPTAITHDEGAPTKSFTCAGPPNFICELIGVPGSVANETGDLTTEVLVADARKAITRERGSDGSSVANEIGIDSELGQSRNVRALSQECGQIQLGFVIDDDPVQTAVLAETLYFEGNITVEHLDAVHDSFEGRQIVKVKFTVDEGGEKIEETILMSPTGAFNLPSVVRVTSTTRSLLYKLIRTEVIEPVVDGGTDAQSD